MHKVLSLLIILFFLTEEFFHRKLGKKGRVSLNSSDIGTMETDFDRFDFLRLLELLFLGLLFSSSEVNAYEGRGQLTIIIIGLQMARLLGRRILSRWSVLGVMQVFEFFLLISVILIPERQISAAYSLSPLPLLSLIGGVVFGIFTSITAAFSLSYGIRLFAREHSSLYGAFPPLAGSEGWAYKFSLFAVPAGIAGSTGLFLLTGFSILSILFSLSVSALSASVLIYKQKTFNGHHPIAHVLWGVSFLLLYLIAVTGITTVAPPL